MSKQRAACGVTAALDGYLVDVQLLLEQTMLQLTSFWQNLCNLLAFFGGFFWGGVGFGFGFFFFLSF